MGAGDIGEDAMNDELVKRLRWRAESNANCLCGNPVCDEAADRIEKLEAALRSIAANACCDSCREAALVARKALEGKDD